jgi:transitional endoplasmic reticulum ATPase
MSDNKAVARAETQRASAKTEIQHRGKAIILPGDPRDMPVDDAIETLYAYKDEQNAEVGISEVIDAFPFDGAWAMMKAMRDLYGWVKPIPTPTFFGPEPPRMVGIDIGFGQQGRVIWGSFNIPNIQGRFECGLGTHEGRRVFTIGGTTLRKHEPDIADLVARTKHYVKTESIYKGQPVMLVADEEGVIDWGRPPKFVDTSKTDITSLIFSEELMRQVDTNIFVPIEKTETCRALGIPLKRGVLLEGPYGTGKTLTATVTAKKAQDNGWTFIMVNHPGALPSVIDIARLYQPCVVFAEDIDRVMAGANRDVTMDFILNTIDGVHSKDAEIIVVLTTNHIERINRAMLRPGRIDAALSITPPDAKAVEKMLRYYAGDMVPKEADLTEAGQILEGEVPATIREVVERGKLYAIREMETPEGIIEQINGDILADAARGMKTHLSFLKEPDDRPLTGGEHLAVGMKKALGEVVTGDIDMSDITNTMLGVQTHMDTRTMSIMKTLKDLRKYVEAKLGGK